MTVSFDLISFLADGWAEVRLAGSDRPPVRVLVMMGERDGRENIEGILILGDKLDTEALRSIPLQKLEAQLNHPKLGMPKVKFDLTPEQMADFAARNVLFPEEFAMIDQGIQRFLWKSPEAPQPEKKTTRRRPPLSRPDGTDPDGFSRRVAEAYQDVVLTTSKPATVLAAEAGVPVTTVHRWIRDARQRGFLPRARKGRAG